jgi:hypothetical protein
MVERESPALLAVIEKQGAVISRAQALRGGLSRHAVGYRIRVGGPWQPILPGVYLTLTGQPTLAQREMAAVLYGGQPTVITGLAAVRHLGLPVTGSELIDILVPAARQCRSVSYVAVHRTRQYPKRVMRRGLIQFALPARAVADASRWMTSLRDVRALVSGAVQDRKCTVDELLAELRCGPQHGSALLRKVLAEVADGSRSAPEAELRVLIKKAGLPMPLFNPKLYLPDGTFLAQVDAWWPEAGVAIEIDSKRWHIRPEDWERTMDRHTRLGQYSIVSLHFTPYRLRKDPAFVVTQMRNAYNSGIARPRLNITARPVTSRDLMDVASSRL